MRIKLLLWILTMIGIFTTSAHGVKFNEAPLLAEGVSMDDKGLTFKEKLNSEEYDSFIASMPQNQIDPTSIDRSLLPPWGVKIVNVKHGSPAEALGLHEGSIIVTCNGAAFWNQNIEMLPRGPDDPTRVIEVASPDGTIKTYSLPPGKIGVDMDFYEYPEKYLLRHMPRGKWDTDMLVASIAWIRGRPEIAETAIARALAKGMPANEFSLYYGSLLAMYRGDHDTARRYFTKLRKPAGADDHLPRYFLVGLATLAFEYHEIELLKRVTGEDSDLVIYPKPSDVDIWNAVKIDHTKPLFLSARKFSGKNIMNEVQSLPSPWMINDDMLQDSKWVKGGDFFYSGEPGRSFMIYFGHPLPLRDMIWEMRFVFGSTATPDPKFANSFAFKIINQKRTQSAALPLRIMESGSTLALVNFGEAISGRRWTSFSGACVERTLFTQRLAPMLDSSHVQQFRSLHYLNAKAKPIPPGFAAMRLTLVRMGDEVEISADDHPVLRMSIDANVRNVGCYIGIVGMTVAIEEMTLRRITKPE